MLPELASLLFVGEVVAVPPLLQTALNGRHTQTPRSVTPYTLCLPSDTMYFLFEKIHA